MVPQLLWLLGSSIFLVFGAMHLLLTFFSNKFHPKEKKAFNEMNTTYPLISKQTTMWRAWIGFNASHSAGAIFFGGVNLILAIGNFSLLRDSIAILTLDFLFSLYFMLLARRYWFNIPFSATVVANLCFIISVMLMVAEGTTS